LRLDKWLFFARFFTSRGPAPEARRLYEDLPLP
jgi:ribosomal 50S subunit-recycling heat shock protein